MTDKREKKDRYKVDMKANEVKCPFCGEEGFDLLGLAGHISRDCQEYTKLLMRLIPRRFI